MSNQYCKLTYCSRLAVAIVSAALGLTPLDIHPAAAAVLTYDFSLRVTNAEGSLQATNGQTYSGYFSYDDAQISGPNPNFGSPYPTPNAIYTSYPTDFSLNFNNQSYPSAALFPYSRGIGGTILQFRATGYTASPNNSFGAQPTPTGYELVYAGLAARTQGSSSPFNLEISYYPHEVGNSFQAFDFAGTGGRNSGTAAFSIRASAGVPEPNGTIGLVATAGLGWFLRRLSSQRLNNLSQAQLPSEQPESPQRR